MGNNQIPRNNTLPKYLSPLVTNDPSVIKGDQGDVGPAGPAGQAGATGPIGPAGPMPTVTGDGFAHVTGGAWDGAARNPTNAEVGLGNVQNLDQTDPANITQDTTHRFATDVEKITWNGKADAAHNHNLNDLSEKSYNSLTDKPVNGAAPATFTPANPTGVSVNTYRMQGLGSVISMTPLKSGKIRITISGKCLGTATAEIGIKLAYGTGVPPINGVAASGTVIGSTYANGIVATAGACTSIFSKSVIATGLTIGTAYWIDLQIARTSALAATVSVQQLEATLEELPY